MKECVKWVAEHFDIDEQDKNVHLKKAVPSQASRQDSATCTHSNTHKRGSSAKYKRTTCKDCGLVWQEERDPPTKTPEECHHRRTDHRGSNGLVRKTYCIDCGTFIDSVPQELARTFEEADAPWISEEEQALIDRVAARDTINKEQLIQAARGMLEEAERLVESLSFSM